METQYKVCPQCKMTAPLDAPQCSVCGHVFRTQFAPPDKTYMAQGPPASSGRRKAVLIAVSTVSVVAAVLCLVIGQTDWQERQNPSSASVSPAGADSEDTDATRKQQPRTDVSALEMSRRILPYQIGQERIRAVYGEPDKIQSFNSGGYPEETWYYHRDDGTLQIAFGMSGIAERVNVW